MKEKFFLLLFIPLFIACSEEQTFQLVTSVSIKGERFYINGKVFSIK